MASIIENLVSVLEQENSEYEQLLGYSLKKTPIIVAGKPQELEQITEDEQIVVNRIQKLEIDTKAAIDKAESILKELGL